MKKLISQDKNMEIAYQLPSWAKQRDLGKINLVYYQLKIELDGDKEIKTKSASSHTPFLRLTFTPSLPALVPPKECRGGGEWGVAISP